MTREYKFRGKRIDTGEWVYGYYAYHKDYGKGRDTHRIYEVYAESDPETFFTTFYEVDPDTVGQYLKDRNGKEIYEGDLLKSGDVIFEVWWSEDTLCYMLDMVNPSKGMAVRMSDLNNTDMEVIGNIHDNPELLEGGK